MIYVTSDLHGFSLEKFKGLLDKAGFNDNDFLFVLGDVVDCGDDVVKILVWLMHIPNAQPILGNHEAMMLACDFVCNEITDESLNTPTSEKLSLLSNWIYNGVDKTMNGLKQLMRTSPEQAEDIFEYLREAPLYETVTAGGNDFLLVHSGLNNFLPDKTPDDYTSEELLWAWPELDEKYYNDITTVFGHTPTQSFGAQYKGKILKTDTWIDVDTGAACGGTPSLLRLDDLKEYYI